MNMRGPNRAALVVALPILVVGATTAALAEPISNAYDGLYSGQSHKVKPLSAARCAGGKHYVVKITDGNLKGQATGHEAGIRGFVTSDGFFTGTYRFADGSKSLIQGSIGGNLLVGGLMSPDDGCAWVLDLAKQE